MKTTPSTRFSTSPHKLVLSSAIALFTLAALPAGAATIVVPNFSFEDPATGDNSNYFDNIPNWTKFVSMPAVVSGLHVNNPADGLFTGTNGSGTPTGGHGAQVLATYTSVNGAIAGAYQVLADTPLIAGQTYTMTVAVGDFNSHSPTDFVLAIGTSLMTVPTSGDPTASSGSHLATFNGLASQLVNDRLNDFSVSYTANGTEGLGNLRIALWSVNDTGTGENVPFDNVRLTVIPEPSAALLGGIGLLALLRRRR